MKILALPLLTSCVYLSHVPPENRSDDERIRSVVGIEVSCGGGELGSFRRGTGVVISERHVLTAAHVVACHTIPGVRVRFSDGHKDRMAVIEESESADVAKLELVHAGRIGLHIAPPTLGYGSYGSTACVARFRPFPMQDCGDYMGQGVVMVGTDMGDSGAPVYDDQSGDLSGLVWGGSEDGLFTKFVPVTSRWLDGT
jgi:hypothetical protein